LLRGPLLTGLAGGSALALVGLYDPHESGSYGFCPFLEITGLPCPACGGLRSMNLLVNGDLVGALSSNLAAVLGLAVGVLAGLIWTGRRLRGIDAPLLTWGNRGWAVAAIFVSVFWIARLTGWGQWLAP